MAVNKILVTVGFLQIVTALCSLAVCTRHYNDTVHKETEIIRTPSLFISRTLPALSLAACGVIAVIISFIDHNIAQIVHTTITSQTAFGIMAKIWFFDYYARTAVSKYDRQSAMDCVIANSASLVMCICYISYVAIRILYLRRKAARGSIEDVSGAEQAVKRPAAVSEPQDNRHVTFSIT